MIVEEEDVVVEEMESNPQRGMVDLLTSGEDICKFDQLSFAGGGAPVEEDDQAEVQEAHSDPSTLSILHWLKTGDGDVTDVDDYLPIELLAATSSLTVVPTYVDYSGYIYAHVIYDGQ